MGAGARVSLLEPGPVCDLDRDVDDLVQASLNIDDNNTDDDDDDDDDDNDNDDNNENDKHDNDTNDHNNDNIGSFLI